MIRNEITQRLWQVYDDGIPVGTQAEKLVTFIEAVNDERT